MEIIELLLAERQGLVERLAEIDKMLRQYEELDRIAQALLSPSSASTGVSDSRKPAAHIHTPDVSAPRTMLDVTLRAMPGIVDRKKTPTDEFERAVIDVLRVANAPLDRVKLYEALTARGVVIGSGNRDKELNALSARVYRMAKAGFLESQRGQGYQLKKPDNVDESDPGMSESNAPSSNSDLDDLLG